MVTQRFRVIIIMVATRPYSAGRLSHRNAGRWQSGIITTEPCGGWTTGGGGVCHCPSIVLIMKGGWGTRGVCWCWLLGLLWLLELLLVDDQKITGGCITGSMMPIGGATDGTIPTGGIVGPIGGTTGSPILMGGIIGPIEGTTDSPILNNVCWRCFWSMSSLYITHQRMIGGCQLYWGHWYVLNNWQLRWLRWHRLNYDIGWQWKIRLLWWQLCFWVPSFRVIIIRWHGRHWRCNNVNRGSHWGAGFTYLGIEPHCLY